MFVICCSYIEQDRVCGFWTWLFVLSKLPELGDTIFIVLRKQPLIFLHWYHHITVLIYSWFSYTEYTSSARWFIVMNYCVHSVMYSYYALRAARYHPPRFISMLITSLQLTQMIIGCAINVWAQGFLRAHGPQSCNISQTNINLSIAMYFSYFVLFARFFYKTYLSPDGKKSRHHLTNTNANVNTIANNSSKQQPENNLTSTVADDFPVNVLLNGRSTKVMPANKNMDATHNNNTNSITNKSNSNSEDNATTSTANYNTHKSKTQ